MAELVVGWGDDHRGHEAHTHTHQPISGQTGLGEFNFIDILGVTQTARLQRREREKKEGERKNKRNKLSSVVVV